MGIFEDVSSALAALLGSNTTLAGIFLGLAVVIALMVVFSWVLKLRGGELFIPAAVSVAFVVLVGWWPLWTVIFIAFIVLVIIFKPFGSSVDL